MREPRPRLFPRVLLIAIMLSLALGTLGGTPTGARGALAQDALPANDYFWDAWARPDWPVAQGLAARSWVWGPTPFTAALGEAYSEAPGGMRLVQYFDKSRMEINDPAGDTTDIWYVTNGLLARELITGRMQFGDNSFRDVGPAAINIAGDPNDPDGPTYASFASRLADLPAAEGAPLVATIDRAGAVGCCAEVPDVAVTTGPLVAETGQRVASVFWEYLNTSGKILEDGRRTSGPLFANPFYATGYPIAGAYWARVRVAGEQQWVLIQPFERRVLTYTPGNAPEWRVEMGNVGRHYYGWRYGVLPAKQAPPTWELPPFPYPQPPDGQRVAIPAAEARYTLQARADVDSGVVTTREEITISAFQSRPATLFLQVVPAQYGYFTLRGLTLNGTPVTPRERFGGVSLAVDLPADMPLPLTLALDFRLDVGSAPNDAIGTVRDAGVLRLGYWFPILSDEHGYSEALDPAQSQSAAFDVTLDTQPDVVVAHTGAEAGRVTLDDGWTRYELHAEGVRDFALALSRDFEARTVISASGVELRGFRLPGNGAAAAWDTIFAAGADALDQLTGLLGPYPYAQFDIVDVGPNMPGGLEFPGLVYINASYAPLDRLIYHETAHQWLYGIIGNRTLVDGWIDEGSAEFFERGLPTGFTEVPVIPDGGYAYWLDAGAGELWLDPARQWYYSIYEQGARFLYAVRDAMGADAFWAAWRMVYTRFAFGIVTAYELLAAFQEFSAADLRPLYAAYFRYGWIPNLLPPGG